MASVKNEILVIFAQVLLIKLTSQNFTHRILNFLDILNQNIPTNLLFFSLQHIVMFFINNEIWPRIVQKTIFLHKSLELASQQVQVKNLWKYHWNKLVELFQAMCLKNLVTWLHCKFPIAYFENVKIAITDIVNLFLIR